MLTEQLKRVMSVNNDVSNDSPTSKQDCSDVVNISVFFDGTGNNKKDDEKNQKWSNPARLWQNADQYTLDHKKDPDHAIYVSGVGTKFNGELSTFQRIIAKFQDK